MSLHEIVKRHRILLGLSVSELARDSGVNRVQLCQLESGSRSARLSTIKRLCKALGRDFVADIAVDLESDSESPEPSQQRRAQGKVQQLLKSGNLTKPSFCNRCGIAVRPLDLHAHHADYSSPEKVEWLCRTCHELEHHQ